MEAKRSENLFNQDIQHIDGVKTQPCMLIINANNVSKKSIHSRQKSPSPPSRAPREHEHQPNRGDQGERAVINLRNCHYDILRQVVNQELNWTISHSDTFYSGDWDIFWQDGPIESEKLHRMKAYQKINHFPGMHMITNSVNLFNQLKRMKLLLHKDYSFFPETWFHPQQAKKVETYIN